MQTTNKTSSVFITAITSGVGTLLVALVIGWLTLGRDAVGRGEVIQLIEARTPAVARQQTLHDSVEHNTARIDALALALRDLERQGNRVEAKLDLLLGQLAKEK